MANPTTLTAIAQEDIGEILRKNAEYGESWKQRGGIGAFMMLARKWDRIETQVGQTAHSQHGDVNAYPFDIFSHIKADPRPEGVIDDIRDLRRYLLLVEAEMRERMRGDAPGARKDAASAAEYARQTEAHGHRESPPIGFGGASGGRFLSDPNRHRSPGDPFPGPAAASPRAHHPGPNLPYPTSGTITGRLTHDMITEDFRQVGVNPDNSPVGVSGMIHPFGYDGE